MQDKMPQREFSFWKWIWASMNLLKNSVKHEWQDKWVIIHVRGDFSTLRCVFVVFIGIRL